MDSWLGLHYPATDIPAQSRKLFLEHRIRVITDVNYKPVPVLPEISPLTKEPLDLSRSGLRAVSPIHIEYLQNMGVGASLTSAIVVKGKLWGLIACHHITKKFPHFYQRESVRFLAHLLSGELALFETTGQIKSFELAENIRRQLVAQMKYHKDLLHALTRDSVQFTDLISCGGDAVFIMNKWELKGNTPNVEQLKSLLYNFIEKQPKSIFLTTNLSDHFPEAKAYQAKASGLLSLRIAENKYIFWFKPEEVQVVNWGGNPGNKAFYNEEKQRLSPRKSFEKWSQKLTGISQPWGELDKSIARSLREDISHFLLAQQREEIEALNSKLVEANKELELFSYGLSHDLRAPVRGMDGYLSIIEEDYAKDLNDEGKQMLHMTRALTEKMNNLIDDILEYSRLSHSEGIEIKEVETSKLIREVLEFFHLEQSFPNSEIKLQPQMPSMYGDRRMLFQLWANLLNNALKYSAETEKPLIEVGTTVKKGSEVFYVRDNGIGIDPGDKERIFETFQRAVGSRFKGTGIGLAIVKKIAEKHMGEVWVESIPGEGSQFYFYLGDLRKQKVI
ncbi:ATP-binding protein [Salinimicrobium xinjiangense]|uniref:ATP-binding protein n=1 Tax=Salinimicrobium xinjiangense TaxID=438596 RepID=UPI000403F0D0|nr:ATP-binding protein [Salinimicrobium xinjiangense]